ncbi:MAG: hypothetical protein U0169_26245 [Polyangiaceae bacterium]
MMRVRAFLPVFLAALALPCASACESEDVVVATLPPPSGDGGTKGGPASRCVDNDDCEADAFCDRRSCEERTGHCEIRPEFCGSEPMPVCGCNDVTYRNDCLRQIAGVPLRAVDPCRPR